MTESEGRGDLLTTLSRGPQPWSERVMGGFLFLCAALSVGVTVAIVVTLLRGTLAFFGQVPVMEFLTDPRWQPLFSEQHFGILPLAVGSFMVAAGASLVAMPVGLLTAIFLSEYAPEGLRSVFKPVLEVLAGVPTVVYGYFALTFITPILRYVFPGTDIFNAASAAIVVGIMIIPTVASVSEDSLRLVPQELREAAVALGATRMEMSVRVVLPAARSGIAASFILGLSRAVGETMAVTIAAGSLARLTLNPLDSIQTMTAYIVQVARGDVPHGSLVYETLFAVAMTLFLATLLMNLLSEWILSSYRREYQ